ncbi:hypothetical protein ACFU99_23420 [Streptomyces sp. NPDC057654]|uniref:hypothetical protein n=1 Tax=Streptomyces sp. NPDC057654 TaxID=3346196 RepID=UPI003682A8A4
MNIRSAWLVNRTDADGGQTRVDTRLAPIGTLTPTGPLASRDGVIPGSRDGRSQLDGLYVFSDTAGMSAKVAPGRAVVQSSEPAGAYPVVLTDHTAVDFADGDPNNPRIDLVVLRIYDAQHDTSDRTAAVLEVIQGEPAGKPVAPKTPGAALALAAVSVPAGASAGNGGIGWHSGAVLDLRRPTVAVGGIVPRTSGDSTPGSYPGQYRDTDSVGLERWNGKEWRPYPDVTGWQPLKLAAGYGNPGHGTNAAWRRSGSLVTLRGRIGRNDEKPIPNGDVIAVIPPDLRPGGGREFAWASPRTQNKTGPSVTRVEIAASGDLRTYEGFDNPVWISLDAVSYYTD